MLSAYTRRRAVGATRRRDPDDEQYVDAAIDYVRRYGGGDTLLKYYQRTSQQAFKNYRWNVVLARIYDAKSDVTKNAEGRDIVLQLEEQEPIEQSASDHSNEL